MSYINLYILVFHIGRCSLWRIKVQRLLDAQVGHRIIAILEDGCGHRSRRCGRMPMGSQRYAEVGGGLEHLHLFLEVIDLFLELDIKYFIIPHMIYLLLIAYCDVREQ